MRHLVPGLVEELSALTLVPELVEELSALTLVPERGGELPAQLGEGVKKERTRLRGRAVEVVAERRQEHPPHLVCDALRSSYDSGSRHERSESSKGKYHRHRRRRVRKWDARREECWC